MDGSHIEYCITDICNRNCAGCSHLAPLAKKPNYVTAEDFERVVKCLRKSVPKIHTFWLTGGEPTLHPEFMRLLGIARNVFSESFVGIYSNGTTLEKYKDNCGFWKFTEDNGIVWGITPYEKGFKYFEDLFSEHGCINNLAKVQSGKYFFNLTNYSLNEYSTAEKYEKCGWERSKINVRNGKIYNCPSSEFADLFNAYFGDYLKISEADYLEINETLTKEKIENFRAAIPFCKQCKLDARYKKINFNKPSKQSIKEWSEFNPTKTKI